VWLLRQESTFARPRWLLCAAAITLGLAGADHAISKDTMGSYSRLAPADAPFSSAARQADLLALADGRTNVMVVMVEAMGQPSDPALQARLDRIWMRPELT